MISHPINIPNKEYVTIYSASAASTAANFMHLWHPSLTYNQSSNLASGDSFPNSLKGAIPARVGTIA